MYTHTICSFANVCDCLLSADARAWQTGSRPLRSTVQNRCRYHSFYPMICVVNIYSILRTLA